MTGGLTSDPGFDLENFRIVRRADVYKAGNLAATLTRTPQGIELAYLSEWVEQGRPAIATTLPVTAEPMIRTGAGLPAYFTGLLPEGRRLGALRRLVKTSADDELSLLLAVGSDAVGDVLVVPEGTAPTAYEPRLVVDDFAQVRFGELLEDLGMRPDRTAIPGVQDKTSAAMLNLPVSRRGARFILKLDPPEYPDLVRNEAFFLEAARRSGIPTTKAEVVTDAVGRPGLLVERFDRITERAQDGTSSAVSLAVEDACQVSGLPPGDKYTVSAESALSALAAVCQAPLPAARRLYVQLVFACLTGNGDAHAKNFAVLQDSTGEWRPSPAYDLPSSAPYGDLTMAMPMGDRLSGDYGRADFVALAATLGLPGRAAERATTEVVERADLWLPDLDQLPFAGPRIHQLRKLIAYRRRRLS